MSKFLDRLEQINLGAPIPMGFGASRPPKSPGMALVGLVAESNSEGIHTLAELVPDATLVSGVDGSSALKKLSQVLGNDVPWGVRVDSLNEEDARVFEDGGCDLLAFSLQGTSATAVASEEIARILCINLDIDMDQLRALDTLPVDVFVLPMAEVSAPWTLADLAAIGRISNRVDKYILVETSQFPGPKELEALRDAGVNGLVVDVAAVESQKLADLKTAMLDMPRWRSKRKEKVTPSLPSASAFPGGFSPAPDEPEPEPLEDE